jgi:hypothetical protein
MSNENPITDGAADDPFEAELVAFLDGELDPAAARRVQAKLDADPALRARAAELKRAFDMLDYLPKPEPSPTFATRTLDKLPAAKGTSGSQPTQPAAPNPRASGASTSVPIPLEPLSQSAVPIASAPPARAFAWLLGLVLAVGACAAGGYFATAALRPVLFPPREPAAEVVPAEPRVIENLPLYAVADDLAFVSELVAPDLFGDDPALSADPTLRVPPSAATEKTSGEVLDALAKAFRALPRDRQREIVKLDADLHAKPAPERDRLFRALEVYAAWLARLGEGDRRGVLTAATPTLRLGVVRDVRARQWRDALPAAVRAKPESIQQWREEESARRERLAFVRRHAEAFATNRSPWPFDTETGRKEVAEFARVAFKIEEGRKSRLAPDELNEFRRTHELGTKDGAWAWHGLLVYELAREHPYLPEPADPKLMYTEFKDLPEPAKLFKKAVAAEVRLRAAVGKWPEYPLEALQLVAKGATVPALGPAKPSEFRQPARGFVEATLLPALTADEKRELSRLEGKWPEYPQRLVQLAHKHDLSIPGVMLPGSPKKWDATYRTARDPR